MQPLSWWVEYNAEFDRARAAIDAEGLARLYAWLEEVRVGGRHLFVLGNGGSAASAAHWTCDFGKGVSVPGSRRFRVLAPNEQVAWHTALANDASYADALAEQLRHWAEPDDLVVALSVSGDSENLVRACAVAKEAGARVAAIVGAARGRLAAMADLAVVIPSRDYGVVEDLHMTINHAISQHFARRLRQARAAADALDALDGQAWEALLETLSPREAEVLRFRFGLDGGRPRTLEEVSARFGVTAERIRQMEARAARQRPRGSE